MENSFYNFSVSFQSKWIAVLQLQNNCSTLVKKVILKFKNNGWIEIYTLDIFFTINYLFTDVLHVHICKNYMRKGFITVIILLSQQVTSEQPKNTVGQLWFRFSRTIKNQKCRTLLYHWMMQLFRALVGQLFFRSSSFLSVSQLNIQNINKLM